MNIFQSIRIIPVVFVATILTACGNDAQRQAEDLLREASERIEQGAFTEARAAIDSLRRTYPELVEVRRKALRLHQELELKRAQISLASTDSLLQIANREYEALQTKVEQDKAALRATPEELTLLTKTRIWRDSLRTQFEVLGAKIRYIRQKQKE